jgi:hypothetical protein
MNISEIMLKLQRIKEEHGDLSVVGDNKIWKGHPFHT